MKGDAVGNRLPGLDNDAVWDDGLGGWNVIRPGTKSDDFVKSPTSVLRCILRHCDVL
jgi:hypothetical protein